MEYGQSGTCYDCGARVPTHKHHIQRKKFNPNLIVHLCPNCHSQVHNGWIIVRDNQASREWSKWRQVEFEQGRYIRHTTLWKKLEELGYLSYWDRWIDETPIDEDLLFEFRTCTPIALYNFLTIHNRLDVWELANALVGDEK